MLASCGVFLEVRNPFATAHKVLLALYLTSLLNLTFGCYHWTTRIVPECRILGTIHLLALLLAPD